MNCLKRGNVSSLRKIALRLQRTAYTSSIARKIGNIASAVNADDIINLGEQTNKNKERIS